MSKSRQHGVAHSRPGSEIVTNFADKSAKIPGARHTMGESFGDHKRNNIFVRHLMVPDPPARDTITY